MVLPIHTNGRGRNLRVVVRKVNNGRVIDFENVRKSGNDTAEQAASRILARMRKERIL